MTIRCVSLAAAVVALPGMSSADMLLDFAQDGGGLDLPAGTIVDSQYGAFGVSISALNNNGNNPDLAIIFDSANPTGDDFDLMTPGGGIGNDVALGNLLIIAENDLDADNDGLIDDPDDEAAGGTIMFGLDQTFTGLAITIVDVEEAGGTLQFFAGGDMTAEVVIPALGDNSVQTILVEDVLFDDLHVNFAGSAGIGEIMLVPSPGAAALLGMGGLVMLRRRR